VTQTVWQILDSVAAGGALWLSVVLLLAVLGEMGLPFSCIVIESLFIFTGFELLHGAPFTATLPLLGTAYAGRLVGSASLYRFSGGVGSSIIGRFGPRIGITPESVAMLKDRLSRVLVPTIITARFIPGLTILTSFVCGATRVGRRKFVTAVLLQLIAWEAIFLVAGALGAVASRSLDPSTYPLTIAIIIAIVLSIATTSGYIILHKLRNTRDTDSADLESEATPATLPEGQRRVSAARRRAPRLQQTGRP